MVDMAKNGKRGFKIYMKYSEKVLKLLEKELK